LARPETESKIVGFFVSRGTSTGSACCFLPTFWPQKVGSWHKKNKIFTNHYSTASRVPKQKAAFKFEDGPVIFAYGNR